MTAEVSAAKENDPTLATMQRTTDPFHVADGAWQGAYTQGSTEEAWVTRLANDEEEEPLSTQSTGSLRGADRLGRLEPPDSGQARTRSHSRTPVASTRSRTLEASSPVFDNGVLVITRPTLDSIVQFTRSILKRGRLLEKAAILKAVELACQNELVAWAAKQVTARQEELVLRDISTHGAAEPRGQSKQLPPHFQPNDAEGLGRQSML